MEKSFGEKLRYARELRQMTLAQLRDATITEDPSGKGLAVSYISDIENGRCESPGIKNVELLSKALRVPGTWFINSNVALPQELIAHLPEDVLKWLGRIDKLPYITLAKRLDEAKISPDTIEKLLNVLRDEMHKTQN
jgi:transcriptional regulator with XRE-family HTH domain